MVPVRCIPALVHQTEKSIRCTVPYLRADAALIKTWDKNLAQDKNLKIGICWQAKQYIDQNKKIFTTNRSIPLSALYPLAHIPGISLYSLQSVDGLEQLKQLPPNIAIHTFDNSFDKTNGKFMDTAAVMKNLDLVITVDTSVAHLAGALGVPVWVMLPHVPHWFWMTERSDSPWYPTMQLFRQPKPGDWDSVVTAIKNKLVRYSPS